MKSIKEVGLIEPIVVARKRHGIFIVAGFHRYEACKRLKHKTIAAIVEGEDSPEVERWQVLAEIDENLVRRELTPAQRAKLIARRKVAYEAVHPETKQGRAPAKRGGKGGKTAKSATLPKSFVSDTATKTGKSERTIREDATRAKRLGADLDRVAGTSLDKGAELDALAAMPPEDRAPLIERAAAGETVSAVNGEEKSPTGLGALRRLWSAFRTGFTNAAPAARANFAPEWRADSERLEKLLEAR
jgi:ParB-like chromosome segregation protein Spo0J